jgi:hypothetical protein
MVLTDNDYTHGQGHLRPAIDQPAWLERGRWTDLLNLFLCCSRKVKGRRQQGKREKLVWSTE